MNTNRITGHPGLLYWVFVSQKILIFYYIMQVTDVGSPLVWPTFKVTGVKM